MTSAEVVVEFVKGRPDLEKVLRKKMTDVFCAPEAYAPRCADIVKDALMDVSEEERKILDKMRGNGKADWNEVARAFGAPIEPNEFDASAPVPEAADAGERPAAEGGATKSAKSATVDWAKVRALGAALTKDTVALSAVMLEFEKRLVKLDIGVEVDVPMDDHRLRFGRGQAREWGLIVVKPSGEESALKHASRAVRIKAAQQFVVLLARLVEEGERMLGEVRVAGECAMDAIEIADEVKRGD